MLSNDDDAADDDDDDVVNGGVGAFGNTLLAEFDFLGCGMNVGIVSLLSRSLEFSPLNRRRER
jgi:hypothetical protein